MKFNLLPIVSVIQVSTVLLFILYVTGQIAVCDYKMWAAIYYDSMFFYIVFLSFYINFSKINGLDCVFLRFSGISNLAFASYFTAYDFLSIPIQNLIGQKLGRFQLLVLAILNLYLLLYLIAYAVCLYKPQRKV